MYVMYYVLNVAFSVYVSRVGVPLVVSFSPECLLARGDSVNLVRGMVSRVSSVPDAPFWVALYASGG